MERSERGQILLILVLVMVVGLTVGLSVAGRSIVNLRTSSEEEASAQAFSAAEAGIEKALKNGIAIQSPVPFGADSSTKILKTNVSPISGSELLINGAADIAKDEGVDVWLSDYPSYTNPLTTNYFSVYFGTNGDTCPNAPAIEVILISGSLASPQTNRYVFDPCSRNNSFKQADAAGGYTTSSKTFPFRTPVYSAQNYIPVTSGLLARIVPLYKSSPIGIYGCDSARSPSSCTAFPAQGSKIDSVGASGTQQEVQRKIVYYKGYPALPAQFFQYGIFSVR